MTDLKEFASKAKRLKLSAWLLLPALAALAGAAYVVLGGLPNAGRSITPDLIRWLAILPIVSVWWGAMVVSAAGFNLILTWEPSRTAEEKWAAMVLAANGSPTCEFGRPARWLLVRNDIRWCVLLILSGAFHLWLGARIMAFVGGLGVAG